MNLVGKSLAEKLADQLRRDILRGRLAPGASIKERDNAADKGVSRTPMREAIRILAKEGLVVLRPSRSPVVARPALREVRDQVVVLLALEKLSATLACAEATDAELAQLSALHGQIAESYEHADVLDLFELDMRFHTMIAQASHNAALAETHRAFLARLWRARFLSAKIRRNRERVVAQHGAILQALLDRRPQAVDAAIEAHLGNLAEDIGFGLAQEEAARAAAPGARRAAR